MNEKAIKLLYEDLQNEYDVGTLEEFTVYLNDSSKRQNFFDSVISPRYEVESLEAFETAYGLKKKGDEDEGMYLPSPGGSSLWGEERRAEEQAYDSTLALLSDTQKKWRKLDDTIQSRESDWPGGDITVTLEESALQDKLKGSIDSLENDLAARRKKLFKLRNQEEVVTPDSQASLNQRRSYWTRAIIPEDTYTDSEVDLSDPFVSPITPDLMEKKEHFVVAQLNYLYGDQGFSFFQAAPGTHAVRVKAANREQTLIDLGKWDITDESKQAAKLKKFILQNRKESLNIQKNLMNYEENKIKFKTEQEYNQASDDLSESSDRINKEVNTFIAQKDKLQQEWDAIALMSEEERARQQTYLTDLEARTAENAAHQSLLLDQVAAYEIKRHEMEIAAGRYIEMKEQQGTMGDYLRYKWAKGRSRLEASPMGSLIDNATRAIPLQWLMGGRDEYIKSVFTKGKELGFGVPPSSPTNPATYDEILEWYRKQPSGRVVPVPRGGMADMPALTVIKESVRDDLRKHLKHEAGGEGMIGSLRSGTREFQAKSLSDIYIALKDDAWFPGALGGLAESLPSILFAPDWANRYANIFRLTSDFVDEEMVNNPAFDDISEAEKTAIKTPIAIVSAFLEIYGIRNILQKKGIIAGVLTKALGKSTKSTTPTAFRDFVATEVKNRAARFALTATGAGLAEFETGFLQQGWEDLMKVAYNQLKEKDMFQTPEDFWEALGDMFYAGSQEMVGGYILGTPGAISTAYANNDFSSLSPLQRQIFMELRNNSTLRATYVSDIKMQVTKKEITKEEGDARILAYENAIALSNELPIDRLSDIDYWIGMNLLVRRKKLEDRIGENDKNVGAVKSDQKEIAEINEKLDKLRSKPILAVPDKDTEEKQTLEDIFGEPVVDESVETDTTEEVKAPFSAIKTFFTTTLPKTATQLLDNLIINREGVSSPVSKDKQRTIDVVTNLAKMGAKAMSVVLPNTKIILHQNTEAFNKYVPKNLDPNKVQRGEFDAAENIIHINLETATRTTVPHEIVHAGFVNKIKTDPAIAALAEKMMMSVRKTLRKDSPLARRIDKFASTYKDKDLQNEERLAELVGIMASEHATLTKPQKNKVLKFIQDLVTALGIDLNISEFTKEDSDVVDFLNTLAGKLRTGEILTEEDIEVINLNQEAPGPTGPAVHINKPTTPKRRQQTVVFKDDYSLSLIPPESKLDINALIDDIVAKDQTVNFWVADQLGVGEVDGKPIDGGPSFAFSQQGDVIWASNKSVSFLDKYLQGEYIFIISGSPTRSKLYNKSVFDILISKLGDYNTFREKIYLSKPTQKIKEPLMAHDSWESLREDPNRIRGRKAFFNEVSNYLLKTTTDVHKYIQSIGGFNITPNDLRDGFYKENDFKINDIMLVLKKTSVQEGAQHSTYTTEVLGEVIGVPDKIINAAEIIDVDPKRVEGQPRSVQTAIIAPHGMGKQKLKKQPQIKKRRQEAPKQPQQQKTIKEVSEYYGIEESGFINPMVNFTALRKAVKPLGYDAFVAKSGWFFLRDTSTNIMYRPELLRNEYGYITRRKQEAPKKETLGKRKKPPAFYLKRIKEARAAGVADYLIVDRLRRIEKIPAKKVLKLLNIDSPLLGALPESFKSLDGGAIAGKQLFTKIEEFILNERKKNRDRKEPLSDAQITDKAFNYLMSTAAYKKVADKTRMSTLQARLLSDLQKILETRPSSNIQQQIAAAKQMIRQRHKGVIDVKKLQQTLINFMRRNLPPALFTKGETIKLIRKIQQITSATTGINIENLMEEVLEIATTKTNQSLLAKLKRELNKKRTAIVSGRQKAQGVDAATAKRIAGIKSLLRDADTPLKEMEAHNDAITQEMAKLAIIENPTQEEQQRMVDLSIALQYNSAMLMDINEAGMTAFLREALTSLEVVIKGGKTALQLLLEKARKRRKKLLSMTHEEITGEIIDPEDPDFQTKFDASMNRRENQRRKQGVIRRGRRALKNLWRRIDDSMGFGAHEDLTGYMDRLSVLPGELFGGRLQETFRDDVDAASRELKKRRLMLDFLIMDKLTELYGENYNKVYREFQQTTNEFYMDKAAVEKAQKEYNENKNNETKRNLDKVLEENAFYLSQDQMANLVAQYRDPANVKTFVKMFGEQHADIMEDMESRLDERVTNWMNWLIVEFYPAMAAHYNEVYKRVFMTDLPMSPYYAGPLVREGVEVEPINLAGTNQPYRTSLNSVFTKVRVNTNTPLDKNVGITQNMFRYTAEMEFFAAYQEVIHKMVGVFQNGNIRKVIVDIHGAQFYKILVSTIDRIASRGVNKAVLLANSTWNDINTVFLLSKLGFNPSISLKQLTSIPTYANDIGPSNWISYAPKNSSELIKTWLEIRDNSVYMQDRAHESIVKIIEAYNPEQYENFLPASRTREIANWWTKFLMSMIKSGDRVAIMLGGMPNYLYYKDQYKKKYPGATEQEAINDAIIKFERDTKKTQQSQDLQDKDIFQTAGPIARSLNMFLTTPKQYLRKDIIAMRNLYRKLAAWDKSAGKGTLAQNLRTFALYHFIMPLIFQYASLGFPGIARGVRDEDREDLLRAAILSNLNGLFITGQIIDVVLADWFGKPWGGDIPTVPLYEAVAGPYLQLRRALRYKDEKKRAIAVQKALFEMMELTGAPITTTHQWVKNWDKILSGEVEDVGEALLRAFNFSEYNIVGPSQSKSSTPKKKKKMTQKELKESMPMFYDMEKELNAPMIELENMFKEWEKQLMDDLFN